MNDYKVNKTESEWRKDLSDEEYRILRQKGTERPHTGKYNLNFEDGTYACKGCGQNYLKVIVNLMHIVVG